MTDEFNPIAGGMMNLGDLGASPPASQLKQAVQTAPLATIAGSSDSIAVSLASIAKSLTTIATLLQRAHDEAHR